MLIRKSQEHLVESEMTYCYHCKHGMVNGVRLIAAGIISMVHALLPFAFKAYSLLTVVDLYRRVKKRRHVQKLIKDMMNAA